MEHLVHGVRDAIDKKSWYPAVALALMLPDACAAVDQPNARGGHRYRTWVDRYVTKHFCDPNGKPYLNSQSHQFVCGRCGSRGSSRHELVVANTFDELQRRRRRVLPRHLQGC
jgi:hypothetical protein